MTTSRLEIGCAAIKYLVPTGHPSPLRVRGRFDTVIARELPHTLERAFDSWLSESDPGIWIIRQLRIDAAVNAAADPEQINQALATEIARKLGATFAEKNLDNVRYFPSRTDYLASFLVDLAFGTAKSHWCYQSFAELNALPLSSALRTALCNDSRMGKAALRLLSAAELRRVVQSLTVQDSRQVLERLASENALADVSRCQDAVIAAAKNIAALNDLSDDWRRALYLFVAAIDETEGLDGSPLKDAALNAARDKDGWPKAPTVAVDRGQICRQSTVFGGFFFILPELDRLPLREATCDWPPAEQAAAISLVRFLIALKCCGSENSERAFHDPLLRELLLIPPSLSPEEMRIWQAQLKPEQLQSFVAALRKWQVARGAALRAKEQLLTVVSQRTASRLLVLIDATRGLWLWVSRNRLRKPQEIISSLRPTLNLLAEEQGVLYSDPPIVSLVRQNFPQLNVVELVDGAIDTGEAETHGIDSIIARLDKLQDDWKFLQLPARLKIARPLDHVLSIAAQHVLRGIAWRLPGFAGSHLLYLARNFLDFGASLEEEPGRRVVRLGRPPLQVVLNMTGVTRQSYRLSWLDDRPFELFQQE